MNGRLGMTGNGRGRGDQRSAAFVPSKGHPQSQRLDQHARAGTPGGIPEHRATA